MMIDGPHAEERLVEHLRGLEDQTAGRSGLYLQLSTVRSEYRRDYHRRVAAHTFADHVTELEGTQFVCGNGDMVFLCLGAKAHELDELAEKLHYLFAGDTMLVENKDPAAFCKWYDLSIEWRDMMAIAERLAAEKKALRPPSDDEDGEEEESVALEPIDARILAQLESGLASIDLSGLLRRQPIYRLTADQGAQPTQLAEELYVRIAELQRATTPGVDIAADRWLFKHLTTILDRRFLALLSREADKLVRGAVSLNFNLETLITAEFGRFLGQLPTAERESLIVELQVIDVVEDMSTFVFVRSYLQDNGVRLALDGADYLSLPELTQTDLGFDFVKLRWDNGMLAQIGKDHERALIEALGRIGRERLILCHCDSEDAVDFGHGLGLRLFQGRHLDNLQRPEARRVN